ncbi:MAG: Gfo/Idh/MocA family oxidoreductase [Ruminococcaceae bacterium]|nr:Gfo/Idh/MocA family oxidoreductase [Oscillospiraceae bacterium]
MKKLKVGIIGCGGIANGKHMPSLAKVAEAEMVAFCDIIEDKAKAAATKYGTPDAKVYTDYKELLKDKSIDVVHVCTPNRSHSFITVDALHAGKHVMCEKPMAINSAEAKKMLDAAKETGKKLTIGYQGRQRADSQTLKQIVERGDLGDIYYAKALAIRRRAVPNWGVFLNEYEQGGGPLIDIGTHALDLTLYTMNNYEPKMVVGTSYKKLNEAGGNVWGPWDPNSNTVEDSAFGFIIMKNGATINLESSWALNYDEPIESAAILCGTKAGAKAMGDKLVVNKDDLGRLVETNYNLKSGGVAFYAGASNDPPFNEAYQWIHSILNDTDPCVLPEQAYVVTQILEAIYTSAKSGQPVFFD